MTTTQPTTLASRLAPVLAFAAGAAVVLAYSMPGGAYDLVIRQSAALAIWWVLAVGVALGLLPRRRPPRAALALLAAFAGLALWTALSLTWTSSAERTVAELARTLHHLGLLALVMALASRTTWRRAVAGACAGGVAVCAIALGSRLAPGAYPPDYIAATFFQVRLNFPFNYYNALSSVAAMTALLALATSAHARSAIARAAALATVPLAITVMYLTLSRGGAIGGAVGLAVLLGLVRNRGTFVAHLAAAAAASVGVVQAVRADPVVAQAAPGDASSAVLVALVLAAVGLAAVAVLTHVTRLDRRLPLRPPARFALPTVAAVVLVGFFAASGPDVTAQAWEEFKAPRAQPASDDPAARFGNLSGGRYQQFVAAVDAGQAEPLRGIGPGTYEFFWNRHPDYTGFVRDAHSLYLEMYAELGVVGLVLTLALLVLTGAVAFRALRRARDPAARGAAAGLAAALCAYAVHAGVDWLWEATAVTAVALLAAGLLAGAGSSRGGPLPGGLRVVLTAFALLCALVQLPGLVATARTRESQDSVRAGELARASSLAGDAVAAAPWSASPYVQRALVAERQGALAAARRDLLRAVDRERLDWRTRLLLARVEAQRGDAVAALAAFRDARRLKPDQPQLQAGA